jgi:hypothetical protein
LLFQTEQSDPNASGYNQSKINRLQIIFEILQQKPHVKPQNHLTPTPSTTSKLQKNGLQSRTIDLEDKKSPGYSEAFPFVGREIDRNAFVWTNLPVSPLFGRI